MRQFHRVKITVLLNIDAELAVQRKRVDRVMSCMRDAKSDRSHAPQRWLALKIARDRDLRWGHTSVPTK